MDPLSIASAFATIVGLIGQFRSERKSGQNPDIEEFMAWIAENKIANHDVINLLEQNQDALKSIDELLREQQDVLQKKLERLDTALASFASLVPGFDSLSTTLRPQAKISPQAIDILQQAADSGASKLLQMHILGNQYISLEYADAQGKLNVKEPRFLESDLHTLVDLRLLIPQSDIRGTKLYLLTRNAYDLVQSNFQTE